MGPVFTSILSVAAHREHMIMNVITYVIAKMKTADNKKTVPDKIPEPEMVSYI
jgi:hypothetical protein